MKKLFAWILLAVMAAGLTACGNTGTQETTGTSQEETRTEVSQEDTKPADTQEEVANASADRPIRIATKPMTEQYILGEMLKLVIESETDYTVEITKGIAGGTSNIHPAMEKGEFDLYPEYTSSGWVMVLKQDPKGMTDEEILEGLKEQYPEQFGMSWIGLYGFNNTYAIAVRKEIADEYGLTKTSDLAAVSDKLVFGGNPDYLERKDGFDLVCETYGLKFKAVKDIDIALKYAAMESGDIDVTNGSTTDAQLGREDVVVLEDDKKLQVNYLCSTVVRNEALEQFPGLQEAIEKLDGCLTDKEMAGLNYAVEVEGKNEAEVARDYLITKGIIQ
ncbi:MAG: glycine betaine ABC transporter substrate-binding protein [Lachnospiraceae bacterium]|nr:glycine/betaine ABC transporter substrate-binding protein [Lachnospiraceae bacterium]MDD7050522.1 glycine betaine ABC transporter substrate-binding protein [Lachnospiraceae bacterium]MDY3222358.1 glycine betaine ABC transporter substrate-binding protein [Lachnospiraceae bacterium]MDY4097677.1 glycine betaine ABC transporter substrate-binding protein [Lachnospiraceae bacterium]